MGEYDSSIALAKRLIAKKGEKIVLRTFAPGDPTSQPWKPGPQKATEQVGVPAVFLPINMTDAPEKYADGSLVRAGDKEVYMAASGLDKEPTLGSQLIRGDGALWTVKACDPLDPGGPKIMFTMLVTQ